MDRKYLGELGVPSLPGSFLDVLSYFSRDDPSASVSNPTNGTNSGAGTSSNGNGYTGDTIQMSDFVPTKSKSNTTGTGSGSQTQKVASRSQAGTGASGSSSKVGSTAIPAPTAASSNGTNKGKGKGKETPPVNPLNISGMSRM